MKSEQIIGSIHQHAAWLAIRGGQRLTVMDDSFRDVNLRYALLSRAIFHDADLTGADLTGADLTGADLTGAIMMHTNLTGARLANANLTGAILLDVTLTGAILPHYSICPEEGDFIAWKQLEKREIAKLLIPSEAKRTSTLVGRKCRAEFAKVLEIQDADGQSVKIGRSWNDFRTLYTVGEIVRPDIYDPDITVECTHGIHFFMTRREAEEY